MRSRSIALTLGLLSIVTLIGMLVFTRQAAAPTAPSPRVAQIAPATTAARSAPAAAALAAPAPRPGEPLPAHLDKLWPGGTYIARHDKQAPLGVERVSIIRPASLPYPIRIQEYFPNNGEPVLVSELVADRVLIGRPAEIPHERFVNLLSELGAAKINRLTEGGIYQVIITENIERADTIPATVNLLKHRFPVKFAEPDPIARASVIPDDPQFRDGTLWGLNNTGQNNGTADADIDAPEGWDIRTSAPDVVIGVIDTGVRYTHEDIAANMWINPGEIPGNGIDDDGNGYIDDVHGINAILDNGNPMDDNKHGTHCAGTIAAVGNNGVGVTGVAWNARIMALKFLSAEGSGAYSDAIKCIEYSRIMGAPITSNSWGGSYYNAALESAIRDATDAGQLFIAAAGNDSSNNDVVSTYPCSYEIKNIISVAASDRNDALASFSNFGLGNVHLAAPGVAIASLDFVSDSAYVSLSGTSMACPHVSGVAALLKAQFPSDTAGQLYNRLLSSTDPVASVAQRTLTGGRLNLRNALSTTHGRPFNDDFARARVFTATDVTIQTTLASATAEASNISDGIANGPAVWFRVSSPVNGPFSISTAGSSFDTLLGVYSGDSITALTSVATHDDVSASDQTSRITFTATASVNYYIAVAGKAGAEGYLRLAVLGPIVNDDLANAEDITEVGLMGVGGRRNTTATKEPGEANHAGNPGGKSVWFKFTPLASGYYTATTGGESSFNNWSSFDTLLAIYAGPPTDPTHAALTPVAANDDDPSGYFNTSIVGFYASAGQTHYVAVDGKGGASGDIRLLVSPISEHDYFAHAMPLHGDEHTINTSDRIASAEPGEPDHAGHKPRYTLWYDFVPATSGTFEIDTVYTGGSRTDHNTFLAVYQGNAITSLTQIAYDNQQSAGNFDSMVTINATAGQSYKIVSGTSYSSRTPLLGPIGLRIRKVEPILNDHFSDAIEVPSPVGNNFSTVTGKNRGASMEPGEPPYTGQGGYGFSTNTVWWKWTADRNATMQVNTIGSANPLGNPLDTLLWVYTGSAVNALTQVAFDDNNGGDWTSLATFNATIGTTYYFRVSGYNNASGPITLSLGVHRVPGDNFADAIEVQPNFFFQPYNSGPLSRESGEPNHAGVSAFDRSIWFKFTATAETAGPVAFTTMGSQGTVVGVYTGNALNALTEVTSNDNVFSGRYESMVSWTATAGTTYYIAVAHEGTYGAPQPHVCSFQRLPNNNFANATSLVGDNHSVTAHNFGATKESGEPNHAGNSGGRSVWFNWTPATSGTFRISTVGSNARVFSGSARWRQMDTLLGVYTGNAVNSITAVASNDNYTQVSIQSLVFIEAVAGTTYRIAVDGKHTTDSQGGDFGQIILEINRQDRPANNDFANAEVVPAAQIPFLRTTDLSNIGATTEAGEPTHAGSSARSKHTLWFRFTAPETRTYFASTAGNLYDDWRARNTVVAVYTGSALGSLTQIAANSDGLGLGHSIAQFNATAGTTYHIAIGSEFVGSMSFMLVPAPDNNDFANATQVWGSTFTAVGYNVGANAETGEFDPYNNYFWPREGTRRSVWWKWTAPVTGPYYIDTYNSDLWTQLSIHSDRDTPIWVESGVVSDPLNGAVTGRRDEWDRRSRGTMDTTFTFTAGQTYYFRIAGGGFYDDHAGTIRLDVSGPPAVPPTPLALNASRASATFVLLSWQDLSHDETSYTLERSLDGANWTALATLPANTVNYLDATAPEADLYYRLRAGNSLGQSAWVSTFVGLPQPPPTPTGLTANATGTTTVALSWNAVGNADTLRLERSGTGQWGPWTLVSGGIGGNATSYNDTGLQPNKTYWYRLRAANALGNSTWSNVAHATTLNSSTLVSDSFTDGGFTDGTDPLDVAWSHAGNSTETARTIHQDSTLDPASPHNVLRLTGSGEDYDIYAYFTLPGGNRTLAVGEALRVSFKLRHTGPPRTDNSRTGFSIAYTPNNNPWSNAGNAEYLVRTSYGAVTNQTYIARTRGVQLVNSNSSDVVLLNNQPGVNAGTNTVDVWMEVERTGDSTATIRAKIGDNAVLETTDTGVANGANSGIITTFNRVFLRFRPRTDGTPAFHIDDVVVTKTAAGSPAGPQHPITVWRQNHFGTTSNSGNAADTADPDGDGVPNLLEYALGSVPTDAASRILPKVATAQVSGMDRLALDLTPVNVAGLRYIIQASNDLANWSDHSDVTSLLEEGSLYRHLDSANLATTPCRFLRLRIERLDP